MPDKTILQNPLEYRHLNPLDKDISRQQLREFITTRPMLEEMLKMLTGVPQAEMKGC